MLESMQESRRNAASQRRIALLTMDVEEWYHLEYFRGQGVDRSHSTLDGARRFLDLLDEFGVPATFFVVGDVAREHPALIRAIAASRHEVASHGPDHELPVRIPAARFARELASHKDELEQVAGAPVAGYRAPCFALDEDRLGRLPELGFRYDSSWIRCGDHPLYGEMQLETWPSLATGIRRRPAGEMLEFEVSTVPIGGRRLPVSGGAYFRWLPWTVTKALVRPFLSGESVYVFYIHPFECSDVRGVPYPEGTDVGTRARFQLGRSRVLPRLRAMIRTLAGAGFEFRTMSDVTNELQR
jgi:polysaccharide deacetylase family protein (PEP-CTERM system associated)